MTEDSQPSIEQINPKSVREQTGLSLGEMADLIGMSEYGYTAWEEGWRRPGGPAYRLLALISTDPEGMTHRLAAM